MKTKTMSMPDLVLLIGTRAAIGVGVGLLLANRISRRARVGAGWALFTMGALSTIPIAMNVFGRLAQPAERGDVNRMRAAEARA